MRTRVVNLLRSDYDVYIGRPGPGQPDSGLGNPYRISVDGDREEVIAKFEAYFKQRIRSDPDFLEKVLKLAGKRLGCFCKPLACHGDVYAEFLNETAYTLKTRP